MHFYHTVQAAITELDSSLVADIYVGDDGKLHKVIGGADTVLNFNSVSPITIPTIALYTNNGQGSATSRFEINVEKYTKLTIGSISGKQDDWNCPFIYGINSSGASTVLQNSNGSNLSFNITNYEYLSFKIQNGIKDLTIVFSNISIQ